MRIGFHVPGLWMGKGGIERLAARLTAWLAERNHECVVFGNAAFAGKKPVYALHPAVTAVFPSSNTAKYREMLLGQKLDVFCTLSATSDALRPFRAVAGTGVPFLYSEHSNPFVIEQERWNRLERLALCAGADVVHLLLASYKSSLPDFLRHKARVIGNPVNVPKTDANGPARKKTILAVGRLREDPKQQSLLFRAFHSLRRNYPDWNLLVCGDGPSRGYYERLIQVYGLEDSAVLAGTVDDVESCYQGAAIFCMPSRYEGFPISLLEAFAHGLPAVGFRACSGVNEIIRDGHNGLLAETMNATDLAHALETLMNNAALRERLGKEAARTARIYSSDVIFRHWEAMLAETAASRGKTALSALPQETEYDNCLHSLHYLINRDRFGNTRRKQTMTDICGKLRKDFTSRT